MPGEEPTQRRSLRHRSYRAIWAAISTLLRTRLMAGVLTVLPIWITWAVVRFVFTTMKDATEPFARWVTIEYGKNPLAPVPAFFKQRLEWMVPFVAVLMTLFLLYLLGLVTANVFGRRIISLFERLVDRVPIAKTVYRSTKQVISSLAGDAEMRRARVVLVEFPRPGMKCLGFLTSMIKDKDTGRDLCAVFIATTPNPTTGYLQIMPIEDVSETDLTMEEAIKMAMSGGVLAPSELSFDKVRPPTAVTLPRPKTDGAKPA